MQTLDFKTKLNDRIHRLVSRHSLYSNIISRPLIESPNVSAMKEGLLVTEDELCFLLSFLNNDELDRFHRCSTIQWSDGIEIINNRPQFKDPLTY